MPLQLALYLVTDSSPAILGSRSLCGVVEAAIRGGVTCVQLRDKTSDTAALVAAARELHAVTSRHGVPLLVNDRVDVAMAAGCEGVHLGQDDMDYATARRLLGSDKIIGITASTVEEAVKASEDGADYIGIGTVFSTSTKKDTKHIIGVPGLRNILQALPPSAKTQTVCIGGVNASNLQHVIFQSGSRTRTLDGVAIVSAIMAAENPEDEARRLLDLVRSPPTFRQDLAAGGRGGDDAVPRRSGAVSELLALVPSVVKAVNDKGPLSHNMTNMVVQNIAANIALAVGASPIMSNNGDEAADLSKLGGALVVNMGTVTPESLRNYQTSIKAYNLSGGPVIFDPVGAGATAVRRDAVKTILGCGYINVIKGNEGEILTCLASQPTPSPESSGQPQQKGVDSSTTLSVSQKTQACTALALRERNLVLMTGPTDILTDGTRTLRVDNGHELLSAITGAGCVLGTVVSAAVAAWPEDALVACLAGLLVFEIAAEMAAERAEVRGPGTFVPALLDELYRLRRATAEGDTRWLRLARVAVISAEEA